MSGVHAPRLEPIEVATGLVVGVVAENPRGRGVTAVSPVESLERAVLRGLVRPPCVVSFSGGRDSSAMLAVATRVARREGFPDPIPATNMFAEAPVTDESEWQESVVASLGLHEWERLEQGSELDCVGPVAIRVLERHGLLWPFNAHFHLPLIELARGGSLLTGIGGDEVLSSSRWARAIAVLSGDERPEPRDILRIAFALAPPSLRSRRLRRDVPLQLPWLRPSARRAFAIEWAEQAAGEPLRRAHRVRWLRRLRYLHVGLASLQLLADDQDVRIIHPFLDESFIEALAKTPRASFADRTTGMRTLFSGLLPDEILSRTTKTTFDAAFWNEWSRTFAAEWNGEGVDSELVDVEALRAEWLSEAPDGRSYTLAQAAWLARARGSRDCRGEALDGVLQ